MRNVANSWFNPLYRSFRKLIEGLDGSEDVNGYDLPDRFSVMVSRYLVSGKQDLLRALVEKVDTAMSDRQTADQFLARIIGFRQQETLLGKSVWDNHADLQEISDVARLLSQRHRWLPPVGLLTYPTLAAGMLPMLTAKLSRVGSIILVIQWDELPAIFNEIESIYKHKTYFNLMGMGVHRDDRHLVPALHVVAALHDTRGTANRWQYLGFTQSSEIPKTDGLMYNSQALAQEVNKGWSGHRSDFVALALSMDAELEEYSGQRKLWYQLSSLPTIKACSVWGLSEEKLRWARVHGDPLALAAFRSDVAAINDWIARRVSVASIRLHLSSESYEDLFQSNSNFFTDAEDAWINALNAQESRSLAQLLSQTHRLGLFVTAESEQDGVLTTQPNLRERLICDYSLERFQSLLAAIKRLRASQHHNPQSLFQRRCAVLAEKVIIKHSDPSYFPMDKLEVSTRTMIALCQARSGEGAVRFLMESELSHPEAILSSEVLRGIKKRLASSFEWSKLAQAILDVEQTQEKMGHFLMGILVRRSDPQTFSAVLLELHQYGFTATRGQVTELDRHRPEELSCILEVIRNVFRHAQIKLTSDKLSKLIQRPNYQLLRDVIDQLKENTLLTHENLAELIKAPHYGYQKICEGIIRLSGKSLLTQGVFTALVGSHNPEFLAGQIMTFCCPSSSNQDSSIISTSSCLSYCPEPYWLMALKHHPASIAFLDVTRSLRKFGLLTPDNLNAISENGLLELSRVEFDRPGFLLSSNIDEILVRLPHDWRLSDRVAGNIARVFSPEYRVLWTSDVLEKWSELVPQPLTQDRFDQLMSLVKSGDLEQFSECIEYIKTKGSADTFSSACEINLTHPTTEAEINETTEAFPEQSIRRGQEAVASSAARLDSWMGRFFSGFTRAVGNLWGPETGVWQKSADRVHTVEQSHTVRRPIDSSKHAAVQDERYADPARRQILVSGSDYSIPLAATPESLVLAQYGLAHLLRRSIVDPLRRSESSYFVSQEAELRGGAAMDCAESIEEGLRKALGRRVEAPVREMIVKLCQSSFEDPRKSCDRGQIVSIFQKHVGVQQRVRPSTQEAFVEQTIQLLDKGLQRFLRGRSERSARGFRGFFDCGSQPAASKSTHYAEAVQPKTLRSRGHS